VSVNRIAPANEAEIASAVREAADTGAAFEIVSGGSKRAMGRPVEAPFVLDIKALSGIVTYEPEELVLTASAATPMIEIEAALASKHQMLGFAPADWGPLFGTAGGRATLAGVVAANACGARRVKAGAVRDHVIGCRFVNGKGEAIKAGGHVIKNVTGFDISRLMCGAFGTLGVLTELTVRLTPANPRNAVLALADCDTGAGLGALRAAARLPVEATGLAYLPAALLAENETVRAFGLSPGRGAALIRVEGTPSAIVEKLSLLRTHFADHDLMALDEMLADTLFKAIGNGGFFVNSRSDLWRLVLTPSEAGAALAELRPTFWYADWAGGLIWLALEATQETAGALRALTARFGGHATLMRAGDEARSRLAIFDPETPARAKLTRSVKAAFDPHRLFNPGRMYRDV
jgi:glycolate oxidase FAD binding subunit